MICKLRFAQIGCFLDVINVICNELKGINYYADKATSKIAHSIAICEEN